MSNEVANVFSVPKVDDNVLAAIRAEVESLGELPLVTVKVPGGGGLTFEIPTEDPDNPDTVKEIKGVIVYYHQQNAYWSDTNSADKVPECASFDGVQGCNRYTGEVIQCSQCQFNKWGSGRDERGNKTRGKACKNTYRMFILLENQLFPWVIVVPPASMKVLEAYRGNLIIRPPYRPVNMVVTRVTLKKMTSNAGKVYGQLAFTKVADLDESAVSVVNGAAEFVRAYIEKQQNHSAEPSAESMETQEAAEMFEEAPPPVDEEYIPVPDDDEIPSC